MIRVYLTGTNGQIVYRDYPMAKSQRGGDGPWLRLFSEPNALGYLIATLSAYTVLLIEEMDLAGDRPLQGVRLL